MATQPMTLFFANVGYFLTGLFVISVLYCAWARTSQSLNTGVILSAICVTAWVPSLWGSPEAMATAHLYILIAALFMLKGKYAEVMSWLILVSLAADALWAIMPNFNLPEHEYGFPYEIFWWQSVLNILFIVQCIFTMLRCRYSRENEGHAEHPQNADNPSNMQKAA